MRKQARGRPTVGRIGTGKAVTAVEVPLRGRRSNESAANSLQFFAHVEGIDVDAEHIRGANGIRWKVA